MIYSSAGSSQNEINRIRRKLLPFIVKGIFSALAGMLLLALAVINLYVVLFEPALQLDRESLQLLFSVIGGLGVALIIESVYQRNALQKQKLSYIKKRIKNSHVPEVLRDSYMVRIKQEPGNRTTLFQAFLQEEENLQSKRQSR
ncbi:hypothetical protein CR205_11980 [Alteribacter lacisalsi]|uniref:Uncharacterized protein n=1 Tax=Alteribacter lacisalsi TaxID=2045244 RepID=A0A2W0H3M2_9BACI|nr:DUF5392 family protein [Alteribacter lacisalsi]PYZ96433.1 hypothetical protein CR205_11980 [Alteribacter lacisalsi]